VDRAGKDTLRQLKERCLRAKAEGRSSADAARAHEAIRQARRRRTWTDADGAFRLDALLTPDAGARLLASLTKESDRCFKEARTAGVFEPTQAYAADALVALVTGRGDGSGDLKSGSASRSGSDPPAGVVEGRADSHRGGPPSSDFPAGSMEKRGRQNRSLDGDPPSAGRPRCPAPRFGGRRRHVRDSRCRASPDRDGTLIDGRCHHRAGHHERGRRDHGVPSGPLRSRAAEDGADRKRPLLRGSRMRCDPWARD
jgi:hypothetical protein